jgi:hypothetical protein
LSAAGAQSHGRTHVLLPHVSCMRVLSPVHGSDWLLVGKLTKINGPADLRRWRVSRSDQFVQVMTEKLMTYAIGRGVEPQDMPLIRAIDREAARNNNRFSALVLGIVKSGTFQMNSK